MKLIWNQILQSIVLGMLVPGMFFTSGVNQTPAAQPEQSKPVAEETQSAQKPEPITIPVLKSDGQVVQMDLESYISRVVLGEVPASFEVEALKAQAVAARTYTLRCVREGDRHPEGAVCTDYRCCQAYKEPEDYLQSGGSQENIDKVFMAVLQTAGEVICYEGELIYATYFASSGGITEDAREVWGQAFPYLTSVRSPGEKDIAYQGEQLSFSSAEFQERLGVTLQGTPEIWFGKTRYTVGGGVDTIRIGARLYTGLELRKIFGLRSTIFTVSTTADTITFETSGYGHRVGMSQYGADAMAVAGHSYEAILAHYYRGTTLEAYAQD